MFIFFLHPNKPRFALFRFLNLSQEGLVVFRCRQCTLRVPALLALGIDRQLQLQKQQRQQQTEETNNSGTAKATRLPSGRCPRCG